MSEAIAGAAPLAEDPRLTRYWALPRTVAEEWPRRVRRAVLIATGAALLATFAFGASILPSALTGNLLLGYLLFLAVFGIALGVALLQQTGGEYRRALIVGEFARRDAWRSWQDVVGEDRPPLNADEAAAWLARHTGPELAPQRTYAHILTGDTAAARVSLADYAMATPEERCDRAGDGWIIDFMDGHISDMVRLDEAAAAIPDATRRGLAVSANAMRRALAAATTGGDWIGPMAAAYPAVAPFATDDFRASAVVKIWTAGMAVASAMVGVALLVGRFTGVWSP